MHSALCFHICSLVYQAEGVHRVPHKGVIFKHGAATSERSDPWKGAEEDQPPLQTAKANHNLEQRSPVIRCQEGDAV